MLIFAAAVLGLLTLAAVLSRKLSRPADTLGLRAARAAVVADMHRRVYVSRRRDRIRDTCAMFEAQLSSYADALEKSIR